MSETDLVKRRKPWLAALLSLIATGLGQVYNGQWKKGLVFFCIELVVGYSLITLFSSFPWMVASIGVLLGFNLLISGEAFVTARRAGSYALKPYNRNWLYILILVFNLVSGAAMEMVIEGYYFQSFKVPSGSMLTTLRVGDHFMSEMLSDSAVIGRGDITVFEMPDGDKYFVKRIVGLPGETIKIINKYVHVNGIALDEPYVRHTKSDTVPIRDNFGPVKLGPGEYFLMGDNREASYDSRWFGPIDRATIIARAKYIYFPGDVGSDEWSERLGMELRS
ncbi:signal peptidase I, partial [Pseudodesulfovibrio sp.]|nr:signal peptidase I [Pseudodesulfovibrio sp.]